ncbi:hypothetical protein [Mediterraneibacter gnavus]|uniref:Uncharacterized protein n=1 Tax=Mediterraneibacter gnavus (strain CC55_001C) TaxID=1073375 RepID=A0A829NT07_MEDG5|nr:hypothetical protein [Mediterraneibacter gnavus]ETD16327.1 hypothetical protein HMPREF1201_02808 [Mediterraneibacter gnavus CC55_001C]
MAKYVMALVAGTTIAPSILVGEKGKIYTTGQDVNTAECLKESKVVHDGWDAGYPQYCDVDEDGD